MLKLNLPSFDIKLKKTDEGIFAFDQLRSLYVKLTPEEWVRQHFINYLITEKNYPKSLISNEIQIKLNNLKRRCDSIVYDHNLRPIIIIEYKAPNIKLNESVFDQILRYNIALKVNYLIISNGLEHFCCQVNYESHNLIFLEQIPYFSQLQY